MALILSGDTGPSFVQSAAMPTGSVLQVVNATYSIQVATGSSSFIDTGLIATITPKYSTSKILISVSHGGCYATAAGVGIGINLLRNSTIIDSFAINSSYIGGGATSGAMTQAATNYLDSPSTTSAVTYKTQFNNNQASASARVQNNNDTSTITLMEIAG